MIIQKSLNHLKEKGQDQDAFRLPESRGPPQTTHLTRLKKASLISDERKGAALYSSVADAMDPVGAIWNLLRPNLEDAQARHDRKRADEVVRNRHRDRT